MAERTRTDTWIGRDAPTRFTSAFSSARRSFDWRSSGISPISSRKRVPWSASSKAPFRSRSAPEKAPFSWPKSSLSMSVSGMAAQFTGMNGPLARGERAWRARATSSLPVPVSPRMVTAASAGASRSMRSKTCRMPASRENMPS